MIPAERSHLNVTAKTHPGMSGKNNEDRYAVSAYRLEGNKNLPAVFAVISDGVGGHLAGEVASEIAVERISEVIAASDGSQPIQTIREGIIRASQEILALSEKDLEKAGMGATCACAWVIEDRLYLAYVGDSRIYLLHGNNITQLSTDHTWIQEAIEAGMLSPEDARRHPNAHVIRRYLGSKLTVEPDTRLRLTPGESDMQAQANQGMRLLPGDQVLLCTDGLTDLVNAGEIFSALKNPDKDQALSNLIDLANERGGHDNITIITLGMPFPVAEAEPTLRIPQKRRSNLVLTCLAASAFAAVLLAFLVGGFLFMRRRSALLSLTPTATLVAATAQPTTLTTTSIAPTETPSSIPDTSTLPAANPTASNSTPLPATLTPWPTNTASP